MGYPVAEVLADEPTGALVARWAETHRGALIGEPSPLVEEAIAWLEREAPDSDRVGLVHADPGPSNDMYVGTTITAVVDWEFTHLGDEDDDWAYLIYMRGRCVRTPEVRCGWSGSGLSPASSSILYGCGTGGP